MDEEGTPIDQVIYALQWAGCRRAELPTVAAGSVFFDLPTPGAGNPPARSLLRHSWCAWCRSMIPSSGVIATRAPTWAPSGARWAMMIRPGLSGPGLLASRVQAAPCRSRSGLF